VQLGGSETGELRVRISFDAQKSEDAISHTHTYTHINTGPLGAARWLRDQ